MTTPDVLNGVGGPPGRSLLRTRLAPSVLITVAALLACAPAAGSAQSDLSDRPGASGEEFGGSLAVSGRTLVVGTINYIAPHTGLEQGAAYVFTAPTSDWEHAKQTASLKAPRGQLEEEFGRSVAISGNTIVVGAPFREVAGHTGQGAVYVFVKPAVRLERRHARRPY